MAVNHLDPQEYVTAAAVNSSYLTHFLNTPLAVLDLFIHSWSSNPEVKSALLPFLAIKLLSFVTVFTDKRPHNSQE